MKKYGLWTSFFILLAIFLSLIIYQEWSLLYFIDITFYLASFILLFSLLTFVIQKGLFNGIFYSFRRFFESEQPSGDQEDILRLSDLLSINLGTFFLVGLSLLVVVLAGLSFYYL